MVSVTLPEAVGCSVSALVAVLCYLNSLDGEFVHDDIMAVKTNRDVVGDSPLSEVFRNDFWGRSMADPTSHKSYRPLTVLTFRLNVALGGPVPRGFHVLNVALHATVTLLLVRLARLALGWHRAEPLLLLGLLFATHPIHTEAVAGIVGRADVLACVLFLLAYLQYIRTTENGIHSSQPDQRQHLTVSLVLGAIAMLAKEHGIMVLPLMILHETFTCWTRFRKTYRIFPLKLWFPSAQRILAISIVTASLLAFRIWVLNTSLPQFSEQDNPASFSPHGQTRFLTYMYLLAFNAWLLLVPSSLSYDWQMGSIPLVEAVGDVRNMATVALLMALTILVCYCCFTSEEDDQPAVFLGLGLLVLPFLPASNLFITVGFVVAERILYIPSVGFCILVVHGFCRLCEFRPRWRVALRLAFALLLIFFAFKTLTRNRVWRSRDALFRSGLEGLPYNAKMHYNFANLQKDLGNIELAIQHYKTALSLWPSHASAHNNLGTLMKNSSVAEYHFLEAIRINPRHARAHFNLANLISSSGRHPEAIVLMEKALQLDPTHRDAYTLLASLYADKGRLQDAEQLHHALLRLDPTDADAHNNYGVFLQKYGRGTEALHYYQRAISIKPNHTVALVNAARLLRTLQHNGQAEDLYKRALTIQEDPDILGNLGVLYLNTGRTNEAHQVYEQLLSSYPNHLDAKVHYAQILIRERNFRLAEEQLLSVIRINQLQRDALHQLANLYNHLNRTTEALDYILQALKVCSTDDVSCGQLHADYGNILKDMDEMDTAAESYKMAVQVNPNLSHAHLNLGVIYHIKHNFHLAWQHYRAAQILEPHNQLLLDNMEKLRRTELRMSGMPTRERSCS